MSRRLQEHWLVVVRSVDDLTQELGRSPRIPEVCARAGLNEEQVLEAMEMNRAQRPSSLQTPGPDGDGHVEVGEVDGRFGWVDEHDLLHDLLRGLRPLEREVIRLRFVEGFSQLQIAEQIGGSQMRVSRLLQRSLRDLRARAAPQAAEAVA